MIRNYATQQIIERAYSVSTQELDRMESMSNCEMVAEARYGANRVQSIGNTLVGYNTKDEDAKLTMEELMEKYVVTELTSDDLDIAYGEEDRYVAFNFSNVDWSTERILDELGANEELCKWIQQHGNSNESLSEMISQMQADAEFESYFDNNLAL